MLNDNRTGHYSPVSLAKIPGRLGKIICCAGVVFSLCLLGHFTSYAQENRMLFLSKTEVDAENEELVDITLRVVNTSPVFLKGTIKITPEKNITLISRKTVDISVGLGDSLFIPAKMLIEKKAEAGKDYKVNFLLEDENAVNSETAVLTLNVILKRNVNLYGLLSTIILDNLTDSIRLPVRLSNTGNTAQKITVISRYPTLTSNDAFHDTRQFTLRPLSDSLIYFKKAVTRTMLESQGFDITIAGFYVNNDILGMAYTRVQTARSNRRYVDLSQPASVNESIVTLSSQSVFSQNQSFLLRGNGNLGVPAGLFAYNFDITAWKDGYSPTMVRNTWLSYDAAHFGLKAGNINRNLDLNLSGRGVMATFKDSLHNQYEAGFIDEHSNLIGRMYGNSSATARASWVAFSRSDEQWWLNSFALYERNPIINTRNMIVGNDFGFKLPHSYQLTANLSAGNISDLNNVLKSKTGVALSAGLTGISGKVAINSLNYYSSGYYPGLRRGALGLSERLTWMGSHSSIWGNVEYFRYEPLSFFPGQFLPVLSTLRAEAGLAGKFSKNINVSVAPVFVKEISNAYQFSPGVNNPQFIRSWNTAATLNYPISNSQYLSFNTEGGIYSSSIHPAEQFHWRSNVNYHHNILNLSSTLQFGNFYIGELANGYLRQQSSTRAINLIATAHQNFFHNKLRFESGVAYMDNSYSGSAWYATTRIDYDLSAKTSLYNAVNYNLYDHYSQSIVESGITQKIPLKPLTRRTSALDLLFYKDVNHNDKHDPADSIARGILVYIDKVAFITSGDGKISYRNLPDGDYTVTVPDSKGWYAPDLCIRLTEKLQIAIPLKKVGVLKGVFAYQLSDFSYEINTNLTGKSIVATDEQNHIFRTKITSDGAYIFYIPLGTYTISIDPDDFPAEVELLNKDKHVQIISPDVQVINYELKIKERSIETKKFISPSISP